MRVPGSRLRAVPALLSFGLVFATTQASQVRSVNLEGLTEHAAMIFSGRCIDVRVDEDPLLGQVTLATFDVERVVKGDVGTTITVKVLGGQPIGAARGNDVAGMPGFRQGEDVVLFLYGASRLGLTSPVGLGQGKFSVKEDKLGRSVAVNDFGNDRLLDGLSPQARGRLAPSIAGMSAGGALEPDRLLDMAKSLME